MASTTTATSALRTAGSSPSASTRSDTSTTPRSRARHPIRQRTPPTHRRASSCRARSIAGDCYSGFLDHQHLRGLKCHRTVQHPARNRECHASSQFHWVTTFEFDTQATVDDVEELVLLLVLVPVVL